LEVTQGLISLTSADPYRPVLFVTAGGRVLGYDVKMELTGNADTPVLQFTSTPPASSEQLLLMLTTGEMPNQDTSTSTQQRAGRLALFLGKNLLSEFSSGEADRLTIRSGEYVSDQGKQTYSLEYRVNKDWSIVGEYDRFGAFNAALKWRVYSR
jgi:translocation and assembly module TamB